jgi:hypothetical protein
MSDAAPTATPLYHLYFDDSGSRMLNRLAVDADEYPQWFALAGLLVKEEDEAACKAAHTAFYARWPKMTAPLHLTDMHSQSDEFRWLRSLSPTDQQAFWDDYHGVIVGLPVVGHGCVVHRPGYRDRNYGSRAGDQKWNLCRTAFNILVERSAKIAHSEGRRLRVRFEGADIKSDQLLKGYWALLKNGRGLGFNADNSAKYAPFSPDDLAATLIDLERKDKKSKLMQFADTYALAIAKGRYQPHYTTYAALNDARKLADHYVGADRAAQEGIKFYCF